MSFLVVASDQPGAGKTSLCSALTVLMIRAGQRIAVSKPFADSGSDGDATVYRTLLEQDTDGSSIEVPFEGGLSAESIGQASDILREMSQQADHVIAEASNALTPEDSARLADALGANVIVVASWVSCST